MSYILSTKKNNIIACKAAYYHEVLLKHLIMQPGKVIDLLAFGMWEFLCKWLL